MLTSRASRRSRTPCSSTTGRCWWLIPAAASPRSERWFDLCYMQFLIMFSPAQVRRSRCSRTLPEVLPLGLCIVSWGYQPWSRGIRCNGISELLLPSDLPLTGSFSGDSYSIFESVRLSMTSGSEFDLDRLCLKNVLSTPEHSSCMTPLVMDIPGWKGCGPTGKIGGVALSSTTCDELLLAIASVAGCISLHP